MAKNEKVKIDEKNAETPQGEVKVKPRKKFAPQDEEPIKVNLAEPKHQVIEISSTALTKDVNKNTVITGVLENKGDITANMIRVVATLYDRDGNVVTVSETYTKPDFLRAGDNSNFIIPFHEKSQSIHAVDYSITAESDEYVTVPEFPLGTGLLLIVSVSSYILFSRNPEKVVNVISNMTNPKKMLTHKQD